MKQSQVKAGLRKAMEFYSALGFVYLPVSASDIAGLLKENKSDLSTLAAAVHEGAGPAVQDREGALRELREEIGDCTRCKLSKGRTNIVFGEGSADADIMFIGEGPGRDEDIQGRPFVGDAGRLLTRLISKLGMKREDVYIANIVKCRPPNNRDPEEDEIMTCRPFVEKQINIISPKVIVCLGRVSAQSLLRVKIPISRMRGNFFTYDDIPVMPTFHPAYLRRNPKDKWLTWDDMQKVLEKIRVQS